MILRKKHLGLLVRRETEGPAANVVETFISPQSAFSNAFQLPGAVPGDNVPPVEHRSGRHPERPGDIRGALKVINNVLLEHDRSITAVKCGLQPQLRRRSLTSVAMDKRLTTLADRLKDAIAARTKETGVEITPSELARACDVSPAAVSKWLDGQTKKLKAENYRDAAKALWVREEWLRDGTLPRERGASGEAELHLDHVMDLLEDLSGPLSALVTAIDQIRKTRPERHKRAKKA